MIDTHSHLDFKEFDTDRDETIKRANAGGVEKIINIGCNLERSKKALDLAQKYDNIYAAVGVHPHDVKKQELGIIKQELEKLAQYKKVVAIGECGLDYYRLAENKSKRLMSNILDGRPKDEIGQNDKKDVKETQKEFFIAQIELAQKLNLPLIIHCRDAFDDLLKILRDTRFEIRDSRRGVTHCFSGNLQIAKEFLRLGFLISFTGSITYAKPQSEILKVVREIPLDKIMIETDCPFLAPVPKRGTRNEPLYVKYIAEKIAEIKGLKIAEIEKITTKNAIKLFNLK